MTSSVPFDATTELCIYIFMVLASLCIGLSATLKDIGGVLKNRTLITRLLIANLVIPPAVALILGNIFSLDPAAQAMLLLVAFAPGGINAVQFSTKVPGELATAGAMLVVLSAISFVTAPVAAVLLLSDASASVSLPVAEIVLRICFLFVLPIAVGMMIRRNSSDLADKIYKPAMLVSTLSFIASVVLSMSQRQEGLAQFGEGTSTAFLAFILILLAVGWVMGGSSLEGRQITATSTNLRNVGLVYVLVDGCCADNGIAAAVLGLMAIMIFPNLVLTIGCALYRKKAAA